MKLLFIPENLLRRRFGNISAERQHSENTADGLRHAALIS